MLGFIEESDTWHRIASKKKFFSVNKFVGVFVSLSVVHLWKVKICFYLASTTTHHHLFCADDAPIIPLNLGRVILAISENWLSKKVEIDLSLSLSPSLSLYVSHFLSLSLSRSTTRTTPTWGREAPCESRFKSPGPGSCWIWGPGGPAE